MILLYNIDMKINTLKKLNISIFSLIILVSNVATFADASIIIAPTSVPPTTTSSNNMQFSYDSYGNIIPGSGVNIVNPSYESNIVSPEAEVISSFSYEAESIDYITVHHIVEENNNFYCYENGAPVRNGWRKISRNSFAAFAPIDGYNDSYIWAYFTPSGRAMKASSGSIKKVQIGGYSYAFNEYGQLLLGFFNDRGEMWNESETEDPFDLLDDKNSLYHSNESTGVLTSGWYRMRNTTSRYPNKDSIWLYFAPSSFKITRSTGSNYKSLTISGKTYAFDDNGVMLTGFEASRYNEEHGGTIKNVYFGSDGAEIKNGFFNINMDDEYTYELFEEYEDQYDDEDITIYLSKNGQVYRNMIKKIGSSYYGFDDNGVLLKGLTVWNGNNYIATVDTDSTNGKDFMASGIYCQKSGGTTHLSNNDILHYFDHNGKRVTSGKIDLSDNVYTYAANNSGAISGTHNKKYYVNGLLIKPENSKYGVYIQKPDKTHYTMAEIVSSDNIVVNSNGSVQSGYNVLRDDDDNYWLVNGHRLINIYSTNIRRSGGTCYFRSTGKNGNEEWIAFGNKDAYGRTCVETVTPNGTRLADGAISYYQTKLNSDQAINFYVR